MATHYVYILHSAHLGRYYVGFTEGVSKRLDQHLKKVFKGSFVTRLLIKAFVLKPLKFRV